MKATRHIRLDAAMQDLENFMNSGQVPGHLPATTTQADLEARLRQAEAEFTEYCEEVDRCRQQTASAAAVC